MLNSGIRARAARAIGQAADIDIDARRPVTVSEIMVKDPVSVSPSTSSLEAIEIMRSNRIGCLPVVEAGQLVGIVTSYDFLEASAALFKQHLGGASSS